MQRADGSYHAIVHCGHRAEVDQLLAELVTQRNANGTRPHPTAKPESTSQP
jgi:hypothetical protein